jgi:hypothetical protein
MSFDLYMVFKVVYTHTKTNERKCKVFWLVIILLIWQFF